MRSVVFPTDYKKNTFPQMIQGSNLFVNRKLIRKKSFRILTQNEDLNMPSNEAKKKELTSVLNLSNKCCRLFFCFSYYKILISLPATAWGPYLILDTRNWNNS